jgi:hypothetical protein
MIDTSYGLPPSVSWTLEHFTALRHKELHARKQLTPDTYNVICEAPSATDKIFLPPLDTRFEHLKQFSKL